MPNNFTLSRIPSEGQIPPAIPLTVSKYKLLSGFSVNEHKRSSEIFKEVDRHATDIAHRKYKTFKDFIWALIFARNITSDIDKIR